MINRCNSSSSNVEIVKPSLVPTVQKQDKKGTVYTEIKGTLYSQDEMNRVTDSFKKVLGKGKVIQVITTVSAPVHDTVSAVIYVDTFNHIMRSSDSTRFYKQTFTGNWTTKQGQFTLYIVPDTVTYVTTWKTRLFKRDQLTANAYHSDTLFRPVSGYVYTAKAPKPIIDFDLFLGLDLFTRKPVVAAGAGLHIFSIKSKN